jgi:hypothetical protein
MDPTPGPALAAPLRGVIVRSVVDATTITGGQLLPASMIMATSSRTPSPRATRQAAKEMAAIEDEWRTRLAREGLTGDIVAALTNALSQQPEATTETVGTARPDPPISV